MMKSTMGITVLKVHIGNPANPRKLEPLEFLVDSGAVYSVVPGKVLKKLGIKPVSTEEFHMANGEAIVRKKGIAFFRYEDRAGGADVIFGESNDATLLGALTLEALGLALDPLRRQLKPMPMVL